MLQQKVQALLRYFCESNCKIWIDVWYIYFLYMPIYTCVFIDLCKGVCFLGAIVIKRLTIKLSSLYFFVIPR